MKNKKKLVVLSGAGVSAESGIPTFRDADGLWEGHDIMDVATPEGWAKNPTLVLEFYNQRRKGLLACQPNAAHKTLAELENDFDVQIITQNVDNLHEQAGSTNVIHLHGELLKIRSTKNPNLVVDIKDIDSKGWELNLGDKCPEGSQLRPHIVWFGEDVPMIELAAQIAHDADIFIVVGTSMVVYPAAGLINYVAPSIPKFVIDPKIPSLQFPNLTKIEEKASLGMQKVKEILLSKQL
jgi:NAD-dependent deacetylase